jgi:hypothetical protein
MVSLWLRKRVGGENHVLFGSLLDVGCCGKQVDVISMARIPNQDLTSLTYEWQTNCLIGLMLNAGFFPSILSGKNASNSQESIYVAVSSIH